MFSCGLCREEYLLYSKLCVKCDRIYKLGNIYGWTTVYNIVDKCLVIPENYQEQKLEKVVKKIGNSETTK